MKTQPILVVDDEAAVLHLVAAVLRKHGYSVLTANDGQEAFDLIRAAPQPFALLLTDIIMPRKDGYELIRDVRALSANLPIVAMSGYSAPAGDILDGVEVLTKPFKVSELVLSVQKHLQRAAPEQKLSPYLKEKPDLMNILVSDVARLRIIFEQAQRDFDEAVVASPSGTPHPDGTMMIQNARNFQSKAMKEYMRALRELNDFALRGVIPARFDSSEEPAKQQGVDKPSARAVG